MSKLSKDEVELAIERLEKYCSKNNWKVVYTTRETNKFFNGVITLCKANPLEMMYYLFLHEIGHAWMLSYDYAYDDKYPELSRKTLRYSNPSYKIAIVEEEIEAWNIGKKIAKKLYLPINQIYFDKVRSECLMNYFNWATKKRKKYGTTNTVNTTGECPVQTIGQP